MLKRLMDMVRGNPSAPAHLAATPTTPARREQTGQQWEQRSAWPWSSFTASGFGPVPPANADTYRRMRQNPTLALARMVATAPIKAGAEDVVYLVEEHSGLPESLAERADLALRPHFQRYVRDALMALDYGYAPFETVWGRGDADGPVLAPTKIKPLHPDVTEAKVNPDTGELIGAVNGKTLTANGSPSVVTGWRRASLKLSRTGAS